MRILFDSKLSQYKTPFGCLTPGQDCTLNIHIPASVQAVNVTVILNYDHGETARRIPMTYQKTEGPYDIFSGSFSISQAFNRW